MNVKSLGQVFTPPLIVEKMLSLAKRKGRVLEPSCGEGAFSDKIPNCVAVEIDAQKCPKSALNMDFFDLPQSEKFDTIIGNPPYVRFQDILPETKKKLDMSLFDNRSNLCLFFIHKCVLHLNDGGELIFIVPRDFMKATSARKLNEFLFAQGTMTDFFETGDEKIFDGACPNCAIFRFEKGNFSRICNGKKRFFVEGGQIFITAQEYSVKFRDIFFVKVGAVSGADEIFESEAGNLEFVCSETRQKGILRRMFYNVPAKELLPKKSALLARKIKNFGEKNWFCWGRGYYESCEKRVYVNAKTRCEKPFFSHDCKAYDGSVLAVFPKFACKDEKNLAEELNAVDWRELGFVCGGRFLFSQRSLESCVLPENFAKYKKAVGKAGV